MPNLVHQNDGTVIGPWDDTDVTYTLALNNLASGAGRQGDQYDFGTSARADKFAWRAWVRFATTPVVGEIVRIYAKTSDGTSPDNDDGTTDAAVSAEDKLRNLTWLGNIVVDEAATGVTMAASGIVYLPQRYFQTVIWNDTADNLVATDDLSGFSLTPVPLEIQ